ncbi:hypothetical protein AMECASPLE_030526 [Ameca splendens]|uniref:Uncharacterized protein n=1 Tax=Ameca splendens TaxID=208324 RepID=A0ABV0Y5X1_9TELE
MTGSFCQLPFSIAFMPLTCLYSLSTNSLPCPLYILLLSVGSVVSCCLQQTPAHFQPCVQNDNELRQPPDCLSFLSQTFQSANLLIYAGDTINTLLQNFESFYSLTIVEVLSPKLDVPVLHR